MYYCLGHQGNRVASRVFSFALPLSPSSACSTCSLPRPQGWDHDRKRMIAHMGRGESPVICFFKKTEVFGTAPGAKLKLMLATLPAWLPSPPEGRVSAALNPGRSLACHRGRWARGWRFTEKVICEQRTERVREGGILVPRRRAFHVEEVQRPWGRGGPDDLESQQGDPQVGSGIYEAESSS